MRAENQLAVTFDDTLDLRGSKLLLNGALRVRTA